MGIPGAGSRVWHDDLTDVLRLAAQQTRLTGNVVRLVHQSMFHLDAEENREVNVNAEAHESLQRLKVLPSECMVRVHMNTRRWPMVNHLL